jgi:SAM-dependent methyltransferase
MPEATVEQKVAEFGGQASPGSWFLSKESEIEEHAALLPYTHYLRQAWAELGLSGILCVDGRPTVYLCARDRDFTADEKRAHHRFVWNQGLVPLLILLTPRQVEVHSTFKKPQKEPEGDPLFDQGLPSLIPNLGDIADALESARFVRSIETGQFFQLHATFFPTSETVDRCLVQNLLHTARRLTRDGGWQLPRAHALLGRALFVSFLQERKFIKPDYYPHGTRNLLDILNRPTVEEIKRLLYREFFPRLKREFNGTMFDAALADEERHITRAHLEILRDFLSGHDMESGQMTLDFWAYDFRFIPVETISAIYEQFMKEDDLEKRRDEGAYYTPRHLAETALHVALDGRYSVAEQWRVLDPACGSGIFLVAMFNLIAEKWRQENRNTRKQTKAQALLGILQRQIRGVDVNPDACRIATFSLYLALFEKLKPMDVEEFKEKVRRSPFLPPLLWTAREPIGTPVIIQGDFLKRGLPQHKLPLEDTFDLIIANPPWESRGDKQIALHFAKSSVDLLRPDGVGCLLLPSTILVNRTGTLDGDWFRSVTTEKIVQLADFRKLLFEATHPCFIIRYVRTKPTLEHTVAYETPKLNRFDRRSGVFVIEPDDQKSVPEHDVLEAALNDNLQAVWSRKFWGTPRDEAFLRRLDFYPRLSALVGAGKRWGGGVGFQPFYPGVSPGKRKPLKPWRLADSYLPNDRGFPHLVALEKSFTTLKKGLEDSILHRDDKEIPAALDGLRRKPADSVFKKPMVIYSKGFTKCAFSNYPVRFMDGLRSITGEEDDADLLRFLAVVIGSRLFRYLAFHGGSNFGVEREQFHVYETMALPFLLPDHELAASRAQEVISEAAGIVKEIERASTAKTLRDPDDVVEAAWPRLQPLVEEYFSVTEAERILVDDTLTLYQPSIHRSSFDGDIPALAFPDASDRQRYADTLCDVLSRRTRKQGVKICVQGMVSRALNLLFVTVVFAGERRCYVETSCEEEFWKALGRVAEAAQRKNGPFSYLRGFSYFEPDRLHMLKPATMRNWSRSAALNDADAIFEHLVRHCT